MRIWPRLAIVVGILVLLGVWRELADITIVGAPVETASPAPNSPSQESTLEAFARLGVSLATIAGLFGFATWWIGRGPESVPAVDVATQRSSTALLPDAPAEAPLVASAVRLMERAERDREAYSQEWEVRQQLARPGRGRHYLMVGGAVGAALVVAAALIAGVVGGSEWGLDTAILIYAGAAIVYVLSLTTMLADGLPEETFYQRLSFFLGIASGMGSVGFVFNTVVAGS